MSNEKFTAMTIKEIAKKFHEVYESLAPSYGYKTREDTAVPWEELPPENQALMMATVSRVMQFIKSEECKGE